jgi:DnaJ-class molecular chaperone
MSDLYAVLGVQKGASQDEIKKSYRRLANKYHPDKTKGDKAKEEKFKEVQKAYEVLSDPQKRQQYDTFGQAQGPGMGGMGFDPRDFAQGLEVEELKLSLIYLKLSLEEVQEVKDPKVHKNKLFQEKTYRLLLKLNLKTQFLERS